MHASVGKIIRARIYVRYNIECFYTCVYSVSFVFSLTPRAAGCLFFLLLVVRWYFPCNLHFYFLTFDSIFIRRHQSMQRGKRRKKERKEKQIAKRRAYPHILLNLKCKWISGTMSNQWSVGFEKRCLHLLHGDIYINAINELIQMHETFSKINTFSKHSRSASRIRFDFFACPFYSFSSLSTLRAMHQNWFSVHEGICQSVQFFLWN